MLTTWTTLVLLALADPPAPKAPPSREELAAITARGRSLAGYDAAAWHASDAVQARSPKAGSVARYIARQTPRGWMVAFGKLSDAGDRFLIAYEATEAGRADAFEVAAFDPPREDTGYYRVAARAIDTAMKDFAAHFEGQPRPYNVAVIPAEDAGGGEGKNRKGGFYVYFVPAPTRPGVWPLGGDQRYLVSADGAEIVARRRLHRTILEVEPPDDPEQKQAAGIHTHVLEETPEDTDVFHVLTRKPRVPELIRTEHYLFVVEPDGRIRVDRTQEKNAGPT